jgi:hypothetical protein
MHVWEHNRKAQSDVGPNRLGNGTAECKTLLKSRKSAFSNQESRNEEEAEIKFGELRAG